MKIAIILDWYSEKTGYSFNFLPQALARLGHEVHIITSDGQVYFNASIYKDTLEPFLGPGIVQCGVKAVDGCIVHRLPHIEWRGRIRIQGLLKELRLLRPQIVQAGESISLVTYEAALIKILLGYKLFVECHVHASVFPPPLQRTRKKEKFFWLCYPYTIGRFVSVMSEKCYPISSDAADIAVKFLGFQKHKVSIRSLGVDTTLFKPVSDEASKEARMRLRKQFGFSASDVVCVYTGRFNSAKDPLCLARAIGNLVKSGKNFRGLFIGNGSEADIKSIQDCNGCVVHPFVSVQELPQFYWASDIGVWPKQESTSQLDAIACGLPIILSNRVKIYERVEGNGLLYEEGNADDLAHKIQLLTDPEKRKQMGECSVRKINNFFSWDYLAKQYVDDYKTALHN